ncbi:hypothetical protein BDP81DRAFT_473214 [Colletotrichum phormii]|uniref:DUF7025 domain-containing protein n=1 Tax=Colletotrichum phormii TaxID=359342 RepID=A0AAJ0EC33_9PEZI|nr:uncharacterized protein BDP81DRAFT_473214 [Colletotrichum phormii]KAK1634282.1 hypothetical protein BDP81DRAFT_473214 [Colletotrichum phormii]
MGAQTTIGVLEFTKSTFARAEEAQDQIRATGVASFDYLWTIFEPGQIIYEKRRVTDNSWLYEQFLKVKNLEFEYSELNKAVGISLLVEKIVHQQAPQAGTYLVTSQRQIRYFTDLKPLTSETIGFTPLDMIQEPERGILRAKFIDLGRRYLHLSSQPFTV